MTAPVAEDQFQSPSSRRLGSGQRFVLSLGDPGSQAGEMREFINSETTISWRPTFQPFANEVSGDCDWLRWVSPQKSSAAKSLAQQWTRLDSRNGVLAKEMPVEFARRLVIQHANADLSLAAVGGLAIMQDPLHRRVMEARFQGSSWQAAGFVLPIVLPAVTDLGWEQIAGVRRHRSLGRFRSVLKEVEKEALEEATRTGDVESATHHAYESYLASAAGEFPGLPNLVKRTVGGLVVGSAIGMATAGWTGPSGVVAGTAVGSIPGLIADGLAVRKVRRRQSWVTVHHQLQALTASR